MRLDGTAVGEEGYQGELHGDTLGRRYWIVASTLGTGDAINEEVPGAASPL